MNLRRIRWRSTIFNTYRIVAIAAVLWLAWLAGWPALAMFGVLITVAFVEEWIGRPPRPWKVPPDDLVNLAQVAERISHEYGVTVPAAWEMTLAARKRLRPAAPPAVVYRRAALLIAANRAFRSGSKSSPVVVARPDPSRPIAEA